MQMCVAENKNGPCKSRATVKVGFFWVCDFHRASNWNFYREVFRDNLIGEMNQNECIARHTLGITYFIRLPNGNIKIGYVKNPKNLAHRIVELSSLHAGKVWLISTVYGGESMEALMHYRYKQHKVVSSLGEQFTPDPRFIEEITALGMVPGGAQALMELKSLNSPHN